MTTGRLIWENWQYFDMFLQKRIFDWSVGLPLWQQDLLRRLAGGPLNDVGQREVMEILAGAPTAPAPVPLSLDDLPSDEGEYGRVELRRLFDLENINCLAVGQTLRFREGLNVVFGDNGSGKSGYGRLIRRVTRSGEAEEILRDVFDPGSAAGSQTAQIALAVDGQTRTVAIDLSADPDRVLSAIGAFDAARAQLFLSKPNVIEHVPRSLRLLRLLSRTQDEIVEILRTRAQQRRDHMPVLPDISETTEAGIAVRAVDTDTDLDALIASFALNDDERALLARLELEDAAVRADQGRQLEALAKARAAAARSVAMALTEAESGLSLASVSKLGALRNRLDELRDAERTLVANTFPDQRLPGTGEGPWREMWLAAERFANANSIAFPFEDSDAACPLCQQNLDDAATERLRRFHDFVQSDLRQRISEIDRQIKQQSDAFPDLEQLAATTDAEMRALPEDLRAATKENLVILRSRLAAARAAIAGNATEADDRALSLDSLQAYAASEESAAQRQAALRDETTRRTMLSQLEELRGRTALVDAKEVLAARIAALQAVVRINAVISQLNTQKISNKLRELQQVTITDRLRKAIEVEVKELEPVASKIEVTGQASKGETVVHLKLKDPCRAKVGNVLSDGEQRALSLAFFLAEVAVSDERSAVVFDDPVSSLDHRRRTYLAERLAEESKSRQVIVFTHDIAFVHLMLEAARDADIELHGQTLQRAFGRVGMVEAELPTKLRPLDKQISALEHRLRDELEPRHVAEDPHYEPLADTWLTDLRKLYEQLIEQKVLNSTIRRFSEHIQVRNLTGVKSTPEIAERIYAGVRKSSRKAHVEPAALHPAPLGPVRLGQLLMEFVALFEELGGKRGDEQQAQESSAGPTLQQVAEPVRTDAA